MRIAGLVLKSLLGSECKMYPFKKPEFFENTRGSIEIDVPKCVFCTLCAKKCPTDAIVVSRENKTWEIDRFKCIACGVCVDCCAKKCLSFSRQYAAPALKKTTESFAGEKSAPAE